MTEPDTAPDTALDTAVILAGGKGTRLRDVAGEVPKPLVPVLGRPVLEHQVESLRRGGVRRVVLVVGHLGHRIREHFGDGARFGVRVEYLVETSPLGTAGGFGELRATLPEVFFALYGDVLLDVDFPRFAAFHAGHDGVASLLVHPNDHPADSDVVEVDEHGVVRGVLPKNQPRRTWYRNLVNAGVFVLDRAAVAHLPPGAPADLEHDVLRPAIAAGRARGYRSTEYVKDMGTPDRYRRVVEHAASGVVARRCLRTPQRAVFLDRDGTLTRETALVSRPEQLAVLPAAFPALAALNDSDFLTVVITNQPVVARNLCDLAGLDLIHRKLETELGERHVYLEDLFFCPHHPDRGYPEENPDFKIACDCRKPATGLVQLAARRHNIDLSRSYFVGDTTVDVLTGQRAGTRTILVGTGEGGRDGRHEVTPDFHAEDLLAATKIVLG